MHPRLLAVAISVAITSGCSQLQNQSVVDSDQDTESLPSEPLIVEADTLPLTLTPKRDTEDVADFEAFGEDGTVWPRIRKNMGMIGEHDHPRLSRQLEWYAKHQTYFDRVFQRAERYLYHIVSEVESRDMPMELALLPMVESAFDPFAYSNSHAAGLWQFIPGTAERFGLERNWWYEGRRDVVAATTAALDYLEYLNGLFDGDWLLALAAYNSGEGTVRRAVKRNKDAGKPTDYWSLKLPKETSAYVPQLLAVSEIVFAPDNYNISLYEIADAPYFEPVKLQGQLDLALAAEMAGLDTKELYLLNPAYNRLSTASCADHLLLLPVTSIEQFEVKLAQLPKEQWVAVREYIVKPGDSLSRIASNNKVSVKELRRENNLKNDLIRVGQIIKIPGAGSAAPLTASHNSFYTVRNGDSLWDIARAHDVKVKNLQAWNNLAPGEVIRPGQQLQVSAATPESFSVNRKLNYKVRRGDSLARIANKFNLNVNDIVSWNKINPRKYLQPGQRLTLFVDIQKI